jgi:hypothetical protein
MQTILHARDHLRAIKSSSVRVPEPFSAASIAFDPYIGRKLQMATPIRVVPPPSLEDACKSVEKFLDGLFEMSILTSSDHLTTWQVRVDSDYSVGVYTFVFVGNDGFATLVA